jgi:hypothetical protein
MAFSRFAELPLELQDHIWESYIPGHPLATAHFALLSPMLEAIEDVPSLIRSRDTTVEQYSGFSRSTALRTLLQTTVRSRAVSLRHKDALQPTVSTILRPSELYGIYQLPSLRINTATDLVILEDDWYLQMKICPEAPLRQLLSSTPLNYLAVQHCNQSAIFGTRVHKLLLTFEQVRVLYVIIEPELFSGEDITTYIQDRGRPRGFLYGKREYFEIPERVARMSASRNIAFLHRMTIVFNEHLTARKLSKSVGLMTWRDVS